MSMYSLFFAPKAYILQKQNNTINRIWTLRLGKMKNYKKSDNKGHVFYSNGNVVSLFYF